MEGPEISQQIDSVTLKPNVDSKKEVKRQTLPFSSSSVSLASCLTASPKRLVSAFRTGNNCPEGKVGGSIKERVSFPRLEDIPTLSLKPSSSSTTVLTEEESAAVNKVGRSIDRPTSNATMGDRPTTVTFSNDDGRAPHRLLPRPTQEAKRSRWEENAESSPNEDDYRNKDDRDDDDRDDDDRDDDDRDDRRNSGSPFFLRNAARVIRNTLSYDSVRSTSTHTTVGAFSALGPCDLRTVIFLSAFAVVGQCLRVFVGLVGGGFCDVAASDDVDFYELLGFFVPGQWRSCLTTNGRGTRTGGALFRDLPANMLGSFVLGALSLLKTTTTTGSIHNKGTGSGYGVLRKEHVLVGLRTGFCGSLTTFASWNTQMVVMAEGSANRALGPQVVGALLGYVVGLELALASFRAGKRVARRARGARKKRSASRRDAVRSERRDHDADATVHRANRRRRLIVSDDDDDNGGNGGSRSYESSPDRPPRRPDNIWLRHTDDDDNNSSETYPYKTRSILEDFKDNISREMEEWRNLEDATRDPSLDDDDDDDDHVDGERRRRRERLPKSTTDSKDDDEHDVENPKQSPPHIAFLISPSPSYKSDVGPPLSLSQSTSLKSDDDDDDMQGRNSVVFVPPTRQQCVNMLLESIPLLLSVAMVCVFMHLDHQNFFNSQETSGEGYHDLFDENTKASSLSSPPRTLFFRKMWCSCLLSPVGCLIRWRLSRWNKERPDCCASFRRRLPRWIPLGTLAANVSGALVSVVVAGLSHRGGVVNEAAAAGLGVGLAGCLSTVSTFVGEVEKLDNDDEDDDRGRRYAALSLTLAGLLGLAVYAPLVRVGV